MNQLLDLSITLTEPPQTSPSEVIASITIRCNILGLSHMGDLLCDPLTQNERDDLHWYLEKYWQWPYEGFARRGKRVEGLLTGLGKRLYKTVFGSFEAMSILQAWRLHPTTERQISIQSDIPQALSIPWELLHDEQGFLTLRSRYPVSIVRRLPQSELSALSTPFEPPLRILLVTARPDDVGFVDPRGIARELLDEVQEHIEQRAIAVEFLRPPTLPALRTRLSDSRRPPIHVLHFDGHGTFDEQIDEKEGWRLSSGKQGMLAFENAKGQLDLVKADDLAQVLQGSGVRLAVLTACQSAMGTADDAFSSVASRLIKGGVDAVAAMSASILVVSATRYVEAFYRELATGTSAPTAQERARQALHDDPHRHIHRRRRDEEGKAVELRDWWVPHFYQQRPLVLHPTTPVRKGQKRHVNASRPRFNREMPSEPRNGFSGRARELLQVERWLLQGKLVVIHGFGGVGKTALVREAADWLTLTAMYDGACFVSFEQGGDAATLLSALGNYLNIYDGHYNPHDSPSALARLKLDLKKRHTLVIADNLESVLPGGEACLDAATRTQLWDALLELAAMGAGVMLTSRDTAFGDGRLAPGPRAAHLALSGLYPEDAYALATQLLTGLGIGHARASYEELHDLLTRLDYHPLAIQLVLPALREFPLSRIKQDFVMLLPKFVDDAAAGRNQSLLASLEYSLQRLSAEQRAWLSCLALFEGGVLETSLLAITKISEIEWAKLRTALEQAALLVVEQAHEAFPLPFLRFHPVLVPYLRSQLKMDDPALHNNYIGCYVSMAYVLYKKESKYPQKTRVLIWRELPNLRRVLEILLEAGNLEDARQMAVCITAFLDLFGLWRERDELRRRMAESLAATEMATSGVLTNAEFQHESDLGMDELEKGNLDAASVRFIRLLARIETLPEGTSLGPGSYEQSIVLSLIADCLQAGGYPDPAKPLLHLALTVLDALIEQQPGDRQFIHARCASLTKLGIVLWMQGLYPQARAMYEEALKVAEQQGDLHSQGVIRGQLGTLALDQFEYIEAHSHFTSVLALSRALGEPAMGASAWHNLGQVAQAQKEWSEAERCYRESLAILERLGDLQKVANSCCELGNISLHAGQTAEAESWYMRALELDRQVQPNGPSHGKHLHNLAALLWQEVQARRASNKRLTEARGYAEQALSIMEAIDVSVGIWNTFYLLAEIATLEGHTEAASAYHLREYETYTTFTGHRYQIDKQFGWLITYVAASVRGDLQAREQVEAILMKIEEEEWGKRIAVAIQRILVGERNWHSLIEDLVRHEALIILRVLETIEQSTSVGEDTTEQVIIPLPATIQDAMEQDDKSAFKEAFENLSPE